MSVPYTMPSEHRLSPKAQAEQRFGPILLFSAVLMVGSCLSTLSAIAWEEYMYHTPAITGPALSNPSGTPSVGAAVNAKSLRSQ